MHSPASAGGTDIPEEAASKSERKRTARQLALWLVIIPVSSIAGWLPEHGLFFGGVDPVPVRINPFLFILSIGCGLATTALAWLQWPKSWAEKPFWPFLIVSLFAVSLTGLLSAAFPGVGSIVSRETITTDPPPPPRGTAFAIPVLFPNGSPIIPPAEVGRLKENFEVYRGCEVGNIKVRGFASSAQFADSELSDFKNKTLANDRAKAVAEAVSVLTGTNPEVISWESYEEMERNRRIRDIDPDSKGRILAAEARNRRAELFWDDTTCFSPRPADASLRPVSPEAIAAPPTTS